jgi:hypothetical protein
MTAILGNSLSVFVGITLLLVGFTAYITGQTLANTWKPVRLLFVYGALLGAASRFLSFALFEGSLLSISGYLIDTLVILQIALFAYQLNRAQKMVSQYPWLYERQGLFGWRSRRSCAEHG